MKPFFAHSVNGGDKSIRNTMRNLIISYKKLDAKMRDRIHRMYPDGYDEVSFEFELPNKPIVYRAIRVTLEGVNYLVKLDQRYKPLDYGLDE